MPRHRGQERPMSTLLGVPSEGVPRCPGPKDEIEYRVNNWAFGYAGWSDEARTRGCEPGSAGIDPVGFLVDVYYLAREGKSNHRRPRSRGEETARKGQPGPRTRSRRSRACSAGRRQAPDRHIGLIG
jgi:hypothetical protein